MVPRRRNARLRNRAVTACFALWLFPFTAGHARAGDETIPVQAGDWLQVKGRLKKENRIRCKSVKIKKPLSKPVLIGTATDVSLADGTFEVLGLKVSYSEETRWDGVEPEALSGKRVKVRGRYVPPDRLEASSIRARQAGSDRVEGPVESVQAVKGGVSLRLMRFRVYIPNWMEIERPLPEAGQGLGQVRPPIETRRARDDEDDIPGRIALLSRLFLGMQVEMSSNREKDLNLDRSNTEDIIVHYGGVRSELTWLAGGGVYGVFGLALHGSFEDDDLVEGGWLKGRRARLIESFLYVRNVGVPGLDLQIGRQDFDDEREWLYDENLDGMRAIFARPRFRLELSSSKVFFGGKKRDEQTGNFVAYASNNNPKRTLAAYAVLRRSRTSGRGAPVHLGGRVLGEWLPGNESWLELCVRRGRNGDIALRGYGFDAGTTWAPEPARPFHFSVGYAFGSGDRDPKDRVDGTFRQTGFQDNTDKLGSITSFAYYGEALEPELSNIKIITAGAGFRLGSKTSIDFVLHRYDQAAPSRLVKQTNIDTRTDGIHPYLGWGADIIVGSRFFGQWEVEAVVGIFRPGSAFTQADGAIVNHFLARYKF